MKIFIQSFPKKMITLEVMPSDTVANVKESIRDQDGTPVGQQRLLFAGMELEDKKTLDECHITKEETLHLELRGTLTTTVFISVLNEAHDTIQVIVDENDTVETVKAKIQDKEGISVSEQKLLAGDMELRDDVKFSEYNRENMTRFHLSLNRSAAPPEQRRCECCCLL